MPDAVVRVQSAPAWYPNTLTCTADQVTQIAANRPGRNTIAVENIGANDCELRAVADPNAPFITLAAGAAVSIDTEGEVYALSDLGTTVQTIETTFRPTVERAGPMPRYFDAVKPERV